MTSKLGEESAYTDSFVDEDMFALDDSLSLSPTPAVQQCNPIEDHLIKQLTDVEDRIEKSKNDIAEAQDTTQRVLKSLSRAAYGEHSSSDSDSDLYTVDGQPALKKKRVTAASHISGLEVKDRWQRVIGDKWIIGVVLRNKSRQNLFDPRIYVRVKSATRTEGRSAFWQLNNSHWHRIATIDPLTDRIVATVVLDLPPFPDSDCIETFGTIVYTMNDQVLQTVVPVIRLGALDSISIVAVDFADDKSESVLALKILSEETTIAIDSRNAAQRIPAFLQRLNFAIVAPSVYVMRASGSLNFCMVEVLPNGPDAVVLRISARSTVQLQVMLRLMQDEFPEVPIQTQQDKFVAAAKVLLEELEAYLNDKTPAELQRSRIRTDLLIP